MPYSATKVANEFLALAHQRGQELTPLKLLKLVYIAHGWSFVFLKGPLVNEPPQAWQYGPVVPSLYHAVKGYRAAAVSQQISGDHDPQTLSPEAKSLIQSVFDTYGGFSGVQLSNLTHMSGTPWFDAWSQRGKNAQIDNDAISQHYTQLARERGVVGV